MGSIKKNQLLMGGGGDQSVISCKLRQTIFKRFGGIMPLLLYIYFSVTIHTVLAYSYSLLTFAEVLLHIFTAAGLVGGTSLWFELGPALQQASALPSELRCTL